MQAKRPLCATTLEPAAATSHSVHLPSFLLHAKAPLIPSPVLQHWHFRSEIHMAETKAARVMSTVFAPNRRLIFLSPSHLVL